MFTKDTAHHFDSATLDEIHRGFCRSLKLGGRYLMVLSAMRAVEGWKEIEVTRWEKAVPTAVREWLAGVKGQDTWSVFSALNPGEIAATVQELEGRFAGASSFEFLHQYDVAVFEKRA